MILTFEPIEIMTGARLDAVEHLMDLMEHAIPEDGERRRAALWKRARDHHLDAVEFSIEESILEDEVESWLPRFGAYAVVILLYTILEVHLFECAKRVREHRGLASVPEAIRRRGACASSGISSRIERGAASIQTKWLNGNGNTRET